MQLQMFGQLNREQKKLLKVAIQAVGEKKHRYAHYQGAKFHPVPEFNWEWRGLKHYEELDAAVKMLEGMLT